MAMVLAKCPRTGEWFPTGMDMDARTFERAEMSGNTFQCPACRTLHVWDKKDAKLAD